MRGDEPPPVGVLHLVDLLAGPHHLPRAAGGGGEQRLGDDVEAQRVAEVHDKEAGGGEAEDEGALAEDRAVGGGGGAAEAEQLAVHRQHAGVALALGPIELAALEGALIMRAIERSDVDRWELREEFAASLGHGVRQFGLVIGEVEERRRRAELLALKQQRRVRAEEQQRGQRRASQPSAARRLRHLIVVLQIADELLRRHVERRRSAAVLV